MPKENWSLSKFLDSYTTKELYSTAVTPKGMNKEVYILPFLNCGGGYSKRMSETVLWFSSGSTKSVIHNDANHNIHCAFAGTKDWILWRSSEPIAEKYMGWINGEEEAKKNPQFKDAYGTYAGKIDPDNVDLKNFPKWDQLEWWSMKLEAGDCAFIPPRWFHFVQAEPQRSISCHIWFGAAPQFNEKGCQELEKRGLYGKFLTSIGDCTWGWTKGEKQTKTTKCKLSTKGKDEL